MFEQWAAAKFCVNAWLMLSLGLIQALSAAGFAEDGQREFRHGIANHLIDVHTHITSFLSSACCGIRVYHWRAGLLCDSVPLHDFKFQYLLQLVVPNEAKAKSTRKRGSCPQKTRNSSCRR